jgi:hypothetical protein
VTLSVDSAFQPAPTVPQPIVAYVSNGPIDPSFNVAVVDLYDSNQWNALNVGTPYYNAKTYARAGVGTVDWVSGAITPHYIDGITFTGGLTGY